MKTAAILATLFGAFQESDYKVEIAQRRIAALMKEQLSIRRKVEADPKLEEDAEIAKRQKKIQSDVRDIALEQTGKDEKKAELFILESLARWAPDVLAEMKRSAMETSAASNLRTVALASIRFRDQDLDGNGAKDCWVADVSGLQRLMAGYKPLKLFSDDQIALADAKPAAPLDKESDVVAGEAKLKFGKLGDPKALNGYWFAAIPSYTDSNGKQVKFDAGNGRNKDRFAFCAYPAEYGKPCKMTFVVDTTGAVLGKDIGGSAVSVLPVNLAKEGWK